MLRIKLFAMIAIFGVVGFVVGSSGNFTAAAEDDPLIKELSQYRNWEKITEKPIEAGANVAPMG